MTPGRYSLRVRKELLLELCVALLTDHKLCSVLLYFVKTLDLSSLADWAGCLAVVCKLSDTGTSMCFGHIVLLKVKFALLRM